MGKSKHFNTLRFIFKTENMTTVAPEYKNIDSNSIMRKEFNAFKDIEESNLGIMLSSEIKTIGINDLTMKRKEIDDIEEEILETPDTNIMNPSDLFEIKDKF